MMGDDGFYMLSKKKKVVGYSGSAVKVSDIARHNPKVSHANQVGF